jgi:hypothetical protein
MIAPVEHDGFPFPIREATSTWDGADFTVDQATTCGPGTRFPCGMTLEQMVQLYWRAKAFKLTASASASKYGVTSFGRSFDDLSWNELDTPTSGLEYYQMGVSPEDTPLLYPNGQMDHDVPWVIVVPAYQIFDTQGLATVTIPTTYSGGTGEMVEAGAALELRLFEFGAMRIGASWYPSIELTLQPASGAGYPCGVLGLFSSSEANP